MTLVFESLFLGKGPKPPNFPHSWEYTFHLPPEHYEIAYLHQIHNTVLKLLGIKMFSLTISDCIISGFKKYKPLYSDKRIISTGLQTGA